MSHPANRKQVPGPSWPKVLALVIGLAYTVLTVPGVLAALGEPDPLGRRELVTGVGVSWLLIVVHGGTALWGLLASIRRSATKVYGVAIFMAYVGLSAYSVPAVLISSQVELLNVGWGNVLLYVVTAGAGLAISIGASAGRPFPAQPPEYTDEVM